MSWSTVVYAWYIWIRKQVHVLERCNAFNEQPWFYRFRKHESCSEIYLMTITHIHTQHWARWYWRIIIDTIASNLLKKGGGVVIIFLNASGKWTGFTLFWTSSFNMLSLTYNRSAGVCTSTIQLSTIIFHFVVRQWNHKQTNEKKKKMLERQIRRFDYRSDKSRWGERFLMSFKTLTPWAGTSWKTIILVWVLDFLWVQLIISSSGSSLVGKNSWWGLIGSSSSSVVMLTTRVGSHKSWNFQSASISDGD